MASRSLQEGDGVIRGGESRNLIGCPNTDLFDQHFISLLYMEEVPKAGGVRACQIVDSAVCAPGLSYAAYPCAPKTRPQAEAGILSESGWRSDQEQRPPYRIAATRRQKSRHPAWMAAWHRLAKLPPWLRGLCSDPGRFIPRMLAEITGYHRGCLVLRATHSAQRVGSASIFMYTPPTTERAWK